MSRRALVGLMLGLALGGCSGSAPLTAGSPSPSAVPATSMPTATPNPTPSAAATESFEPVPTDTPAPTPTALSGEADLVETAAFLKKWKDDIGYVHWQAIVTIVNQGGGWADVSGGDYTIYDSGGGVTETGEFTYAFPRYLGPGQTGYVYDDSDDTGVSLADFVKLDPSVSYDPVDAPPAVLTTGHTSLSFDEFNGLTAKGTVTNTSADEVSEVVVGVFYFDANHHLLGASYTNLVSNLNGGQTKGYETLDGPPISKTSVKFTLAFASDYDY